MNDLAGETSRRSLFGWLAGLACAALLAVVLFLLRPAATEVSPKADQPARGRKEQQVEDRLQISKPGKLPGDYVGSVACRECHASIWERYQSHPMAHSASLVSDARPEEQNAASFSRGGHEYRVEQTDQGTWHHEIARDAEGEVIYDQSVAVQFALGSGVRGKSYLIDRNGLLFMSPISWYAQAQRWDLSPGYPERGHQGFERRIVDRCVACHIGRTNPVAGTTNRFADPPFLELTIGCERCHGPGEDHIHYRREESDKESDPIVNPASLSSSRREAVCNQCHLIGKEEVLRYSRRDFDFRPGMELGEIWSLWVAGREGSQAGDAEEAVSQVEQMHSSRCWKASDGRLTCTSCHDPHQRPREAEMREFYRARCVACHEQQGCSAPIERREAPPALDSCVHCHMSKAGAADVPHTTQTDHRILRGPAEPAPRKELASQRKTMRVFDAEWCPLPEADAVRMRGLFLARFAERQQSLQTAIEAERLLKQLVGEGLESDDLPVLDALAIVASLQRKSATSVWEEMLVRDPTNETALYSLAMNARMQGDTSEASRWMARSLQVNPWVSQMHEQYAQLLIKSGQLSEAIESRRKALELAPSRTDAYRILAELCHRAGKEEESRRYNELYLRLKDAP